jgi:NAD(P)-dependent dehydrogenase (short-subunit alcohol dehydrogenase family)
MDGCTTSGEETRCDSREGSLWLSAGSGIGKTTVDQFIAGGAQVIAVDIVEGTLQAGFNAWQASGGEVTGVVANAMEEADVDRMIETAHAIYGRLDILCNYAGIMDMMTPAADVSTDLWNRVLGVHLTGPFLARRKALPGMIAQGGAASSTPLQQQDCAAARRAHPTRSPNTV